MAPVCWLLGVVLLLLARTAPAHWYVEEQAIMGTHVRVELWSPDAARARDALTAVAAELRRIDAAMSTYREDSEVSRVNREAARAPAAVSGELFTLLQRAREISLRTDGAFDVTYASAGALYDYRAATRPDEETLQAAVQHIGFRGLRLEPGARTVSFAREGMRIDLGGIAKGYAVEQAASVLRQRGIMHALVSAGGDARFIGDRRGRPWHIAIRDPRDRQRNAALLPVRDEALSTSGDYERFFVEDGARYHHIIDPATGRSPGSVTSVSVIGPDATVTDALATGLFVLGVERGLVVLDRFPGYDAVFIDAEGRLHLSRNIEHAPR